MPKTRTRLNRFLFALSPDERAALERLQQFDGISGADVLRRLLRQAAREAGVLADAGAPAAISTPGPASVYPWEEVDSES